MSIPTPHIEAKKGDFAPVVLMPGDPLRSAFIAQNYLQDARLINNVRGVQGYTGCYHGRPVSVMASGMGMPSMGIYSYELFAFYGVEAIIRVGSAGAISDKLKLRDIVLGQGACTNSNYAAQYQLPGAFCPIAGFDLLCGAVDAARQLGYAVQVGNLFSSDTFYDDANSLAAWKKMGVLAIEMESAALYCNAARLGKQALCICTVSDNPFTGEGCSSQERQTTFTQMMEIALATATRWQG